MERVTAPQSRCTAIPGVRDRANSCVSNAGRSCAGIVGTLCFLSISLAFLSDSMASAQSGLNSAWVGWTLVGAIWAIALGLIIGTLWQEYQAKQAAVEREAYEADEEDEDSRRGMRGRYLIH